MFQEYFTSSAGVLTTDHIKTCKGVQCINITPYVYFLYLFKKKEMKFQRPRQEYESVCSYTYNLFLRLNLVSQTLWFEAKMYVEFI